MKMTDKENRRTTGFGFFACLLQDLRYGIQNLIRNPGFATVAIVSLALGIGATTAIFSIFDVIWLRPLPYKHEDRMVIVSQVKLDNPRNTMNITLDSFLEWREQSTSFENLDFQFSLPLTLVGGERAERTVTRQVTEEYFDTLDGKASLGRLFLPEDYTLKGPPVALLSYSLWQRLFSSDPGVIGRKVELDMGVRTVIGVMSPDYKPLYGDEVDLWLPWLPQYATIKAITTGQYFRVIGLLKDGTDLRTAQAEMDVVASRQAAQHPELEGIGARIQPLQDYLYEGWGRRFLAFFGAVVFVLLIACANVANLLLARASSRDKEMAVRASVGADRPRLIRQMLTEGFLLAGLGAALGLFLAFLAVKLLINVNPGAIPRGDEIGFNLHILGFAVLLALLCGLLFSLPPAFRASKPDLTESLKDSGYRSASRFGGRRAHGVLVVLEIALSLVLLIGAGLMIFNIWRVMQTDVGFNSENLIMMQLNMPTSQYMDQAQPLWWKEKPRAKLARREIQEELQALPGVRKVSIAATPPLSGCTPRFFSIGSQQPPNPGSSAPIVCLQPVTSDYFQTLQISLTKGREFSEQDNENSQPVAIISENMARQYFPDGEPIGKTLNLGRLDMPTDREPPLRIVGIVADVRPTLLGSPMPSVYMPYSQLPARFYFMHLLPRASQSFVVRTEVKPATLKTALRDVASDLAKDAVVLDIHTIDDVKSQFLRAIRMYALLLIMFAAIAVILATVGVFGVMSYAVTQRTREVGIRMALGARRRAVVRLIMQQGLLMILLGLAIGLAGAFGLTRYLRSLLFEVKPTDPLTFILASVGLFIVALIACFIPAFRAARVDPVTTLRHE
jgi:predicted permease